MPAIRRRRKPRPGVGTYGKQETNVFRPMVQTTPVPDFYKSESPLYSTRTGLAMKTKFRKKSQRLPSNLIFEYRMLKP